MFSYVNKVLKNQDVKVKTDQCAYWGSISEDGKFKASANTACHAGLNGHRDDTPLKLIVNFFQVHYEEDHNGEELRGKEDWPDKCALYLNWLTKESPYKDAFISKVGKTMLKHGYAIMNPNVAGTYLGGACVATRLLWEFPYQLDCWYELVRKYRINKHVAFVLAHNVKLFDGKFHIYYGGGHMAFDGGFLTGKVFDNFINNNPVKVRFDKPYNEVRQYQGYSRMFIEGDADGSLLDDLAGNQPLKFNGVFKYAMEDVARRIGIFNPNPKGILGVKEKLKEMGVL